jgi:outer membrane protein assembly factor BamB
VVVDPLTVDRLTVDYLTTNPSSSPILSLISHSVHVALLVRENEEERGMGVVEGIRVVRGSGEAYESHCVRVEVPQDRVWQRRTVAGTDSMSHGYLSLSLDILPQLAVAPDGESADDAALCAHLLEVAEEVARTREAVRAAGGTADRLRVALSPVGPGKWSQLRLWATVDSSGWQTEEDLSDFMAVAAGVRLLGGTEALGDTSPLLASYSFDDEDGGSPPLVDEDATSFILRHLLPADEMDDDDAYYYESLASLSGRLSRLTDATRHARRLADPAPDTRPLRHVHDAHTPLCESTVSSTWAVDLAAPSPADGVLMLLGSTLALVIATHSHYVEALDPATGQRLPGWPVSIPGARFMAEPLPVPGGVLLVTHDGDIVILSPDGRIRRHWLLPDARVRRQWAAGLDHEEIPDLSFSMHGDVGDDDGILYDVLAVEVGVEGEEEEEGGRKDDGPDVSDDREIGDFFGDLAVDDAVVHSFADLFGPDALGHVASTLSFDQPFLHRQQLVEGDSVFVPAHVLGGATMADVDGDGEEELVVAVTYFFDRDFLTDPDSLALLPPSVDPRDYVVSGIVIVDATTGTLLRRHNLDLSTAKTPFAAFVLSTPTVVDADGDGVVEIYLGTGSGFVYALDGPTGNLRPGFPITGDSVYSEVLVDELDGVESNGLELAIVDANGHVLLFRPDGSEVWEARVSGMDSARLTAGDVDGDGAVDLVVATDADGAIWALDGATGRVLEGFPVSAGRGAAAASAPILLPSPTRDTGLAIVVPSSLGHLVIIDGPCVDSIDVDEVSSAMVLADDVDGDGDLELLIVSGEGRVRALSTHFMAGPLTAWRSRLHGGNVASSRVDRLGVALSLAPVSTGSLPLDESVDLLFTLTDSAATAAQTTYAVTVRGGDDGHIVLQDRVVGPGTYSRRVPLTRGDGPSPYEIRVTTSRHSFVLTDHLIVPARPLAAHALTTLLLATPLLFLPLLLLSTRPSASP